MTVRVGDVVEPFQLPERPGESFDLADHLGRDRIVLLFFPLAFSAVCTKELRAVRDDWAAFDDLDAVVVGISIDSPFVTSRFRESESIPFPLLSDFNREVSSRWGVLYESFYGLKGVSKRSAFVIGTDGRVAYAWVSEDADLKPDYAELMDALSTAP